MSEAIIALGSNVGDRHRYLTTAVHHIGRLGDLSGIAPLYETGPYGFTDQADFLNSALRIQTSLEPEELLAQLKQIETEVGRRQRIHWGPREIDLDIIFYDRRIVRTEILTIPHPDFHNRMFVMKPLVRIAPEFVSPVHLRTVRELMEICQDQTIVKLIETHWYRNGIKI